MTKKKAPSVKKHVNAVHVRGGLSLVQRKLANALLYHAYPDLPQKDEYEIGISHLCGLIGFDTHNLEPLKEAIRGLCDVSIEWGVRGESGLDVWGVFSMLADAQIDAQSGICRYSYGALLRKKLYNPEIYATINLDIQKKFCSKHALALYENCVRYREVGSTGWMALEVFRQLIGCEGQATYDEFKRLNDQIIKPAVKEVNETSDIEVQPEYKRSSRKVSQVRMKVADKRNLPPLQASQSKLRPADGKSRIDAMVDDVAAREKAAKSKEIAKNAFKEMRAILGRPERDKPD